MRVRWTNEEMRSVVVKAVELRRAEPELSRRDSIFRAQGLTIIEARRKPTLTFALQKTLLASIEREERILPAPPTAGATFPVQDAIAAAAAAPAPPPPPAPPSAIDMVREFGKVFGEAIAKEIAPAIIGALADAVRANFQPTKKNGNDANHVVLDANAAIGAVTDPGNLPEKFHKHKVLVMGLDPHTQRPLMQEFPHLDFRFLDGNTHGDTVRKVGAGCEAAFFMVKFIRKARQDQVPSEKRVLVPGGSSTLKRLIAGRFPRSTDIEQMPVQH